MGFQRQYKRKSLRDDSGQSTVEYLIVTFMVVSVLIYPTSIYETISGTMKNKYQGYCFGVAISDPPRKEFDEKMEKGAEAVQKVIDTIGDIKKAASDAEHFQLPIHEALPSFGDIHIDEIVKKELETFR